MGELKNKGSFYIKYVPPKNMINFLTFFDSTHFRDQGRNQKVISFTFGANENKKI